MKNYFKLLKIMFKADKLLLLKTTVIVLAALIMSTLLPLSIDMIINHIESKQSIFQVWLFTFAFGLAYVIFVLFQALKAKYFDYIGEHILWTTRKKIYETLWYGDYSKSIYVNKEKYKFVLSTETYIVYAITTIYSFNVITNLLTLVTLLLVSFVVSPVVSIVLFISMLLSWGLTFITGHKLLNSSKEYDKAKENDTLINNETVDLTETIRTNGLMEYQLRKNHKALHEFIKKSAKSNFTQVACVSLEDGLHNTIYLLMSMILVMNSYFSNGTLITVLFITNYCLQVSQGLQRQVQTLINNIPMFTKVTDAMSVPIHSGIELNTFESICFKNVSLTFDEKKYVLNNFFCDIKAGDKVLIKGHNGSGKSSILKMIMGLYNPTDGLIEINGENITQYDSSTFYKQIVYIPQNEYMLNELVDDYIKIVAHKEIANSEIAKLRSKVHLKDSVLQIENNGASLSGGEKKKILLMKNLVRQDASVIILDEIDAGLDIETRNILKEIEHTLLLDKNKTFIKISHIDSDTTLFNKVISL